MKEFQRTKGWSENNQLKTSPEFTNYGLHKTFVNSSRTTTIYMTFKLDLSQEVLLDIDLKGIFSPDFTQYAQP